MKVQSYQASPPARLKAAPRKEETPADSVEGESKVENTINLSDKAIKRLLYGGAIASAAGMGWMGVNIVNQLVASGSGLAWAAAAGSALGGFLLADLASGFIHHGLDNYATKDTKIIGYIAQDFQSHHHHGTNILKSEKVGLLFPFAQVMPPALAVLGLINPHYTVASAALAAAAGIAGAQLSHQVTHDPKPGRLSQVLRKFHIAQESEDHLAHHRKPWASNYCFLNGAWNGLLDRTNFWRKYEKAVYRVCGAEPKVWNHPAVKARALENISDAEYSERLKTQMPDFKKNIDFDNERRESLAFMKVDDGTASSDAVTAKTIPQSSNTEENRT